MKVEEEQLGLVLGFKNNVYCYCQPWNKLEGRGGSSERGKGAAAQVSGGRRDAPHGERQK
jgi:hypothetical protein